MKKIVSNLTNVISLNNINNDDSIIGIRHDTTDIHIVARVDMNRYALVSIQDYEVWSWDDEFSLIRELVRYYWDDFEFYHLNDWKEIKDFIR